MMDFSVQKWNILLCLTETSGFGVHPFWSDWIYLTRSLRSRVQLKLLSLNSELSVREHWLIVLKNFSFSYGCDSWINRLLFLNSKLSLRENWLTVLINFLFSCGCDTWITRLLFLEMWAWAASADIIRGLFAWRWGTPGRWGNPPRWGNPSFHIISHFILITFTW